MSPALRNLSPRVTSAAISVGDRRWSAGDCVGEGEVGWDVACGVVCCRSGAGVATGDAGFCFAESRAGASAVAGGVVSGARAGWARSGMAAGEISRRVAGAFAGISLGVDCGAETSRVAEVPVEDRAGGSPARST